MKGFAAPETKAALERARLLIEHAETLGEPPAASIFGPQYLLLGGELFAFNGDVLRELAAQFLAFAEKQGATVPLMVGHRLTGTALLLTGDIADAQVHLDRAIALYDPAAHRLPTRFSEDPGVAILFFRSRHFGCSAIRRLHSRTSTKHSRMRARAATQSTCYGHSLAHSFSSIATAEIIRQQMPE